MKGMPQVSRKGIPEELQTPGSELVVLLAAAGNVDTRERQIRHDIVEEAHDLIHQACPHYKPSRVDDLNCRSGEDTGRAYRGRTCHGCQAGQFGANGFFIGDVTSLQPVR